MASIILFGRTLAETSKKANDDTIVLLSMGSHDGWRIN